MPRVGFEPTRAKAHRFLKPARLPIPPPRHRVNSYCRFRPFRCQDLVGYCEAAGFHEGGKEFQILLGSRSAQINMKKPIKKGTNLISILLWNWLTWIRLTGPKRLDSITDANNPFSQDLSTKSTPMDKPRQNTMFCEAL